jgi:hypothetical protein
MRREPSTGFGLPSCKAEILEYILTVSHRRVSINQLPVSSPAHLHLSLRLWSVMTRFPPAGFIRTIRYHSGKASESSSLPSLPITTLRTIPITVSNGVRTYTGSENLAAAYSAWNNPLTDPKPTTGNQTVNTGRFNLAAGRSKDLLNVSKAAGSVRSVKLTLPQFITTQTQSGQTVTDNGRAFTGSSTFRAARQASNSGVV